MGRWRWISRPGLGGYPIKGLPPLRTQPTASHFLFGFFSIARACSAVAKLPRPCSGVAVPGCPRGGGVIGRNTLVIFLKY